MSALSLKCNVCGAHLKSVAEAQSHGEATGHADFAESTDAVLNLQCVACGKPCRSETEKDIHTKRTGHAEFVDKTAETARAMDTEGEMKAIGDEMKAELGVPIAKKSKGEGEGSPSNDDAREEDSSSPELVEPEVDAATVSELVAMGFGRNRAVRAAHFTGTTSVEQAVNWIVEHETDADVDAPLLLPKAPPPKQKLSKEEARAKAEELRVQMARKKEKEEKEMERLREQERIRSGKELLKAKKLEEELQLKRNLEARRIEKEEAARAKARINEKLEEDRRERRRKAGLPEELTDEERARERERELEKARAAREAAEKKAAAGLRVKPVSAIDAVRKALVDVRKNPDLDDARVATCFKTLLAYLGNVARKPDEEKFRTIKLDNDAFVSRVDRAGGRRVLELVGFESDGAKLAMPREKVDQNLLNLVGGEITGALNNPFFGKL